MGFILNQHGNFAKPGIEAVAEGDVDDAVLSCKRDGRFGPVLREGKESFSAATRKDYGVNVLHGTDLFRRSELWFAIGES